MSAVHHIPSSEAILACEGLSKHFGGIRAFTDVAFQARRGEVTAVIGDNGAGKSTLIRCLVGVHVPDGGDIFFDGKPQPFGNPDEARKAGIETVHQNLALIDELTVAQNLFLNREIVRHIGPLRFLDRRAMDREAGAMLSRLAINVPSVDQRVRRLSGGQRQATGSAALGQRPKRRQVRGRGRDRGQGAKFLREGLRALRLHRAPATRLAGSDGAPPRHAGSGAAERGDPGRRRDHRASADTLITSARGHRRS